MVGVDGPAASAAAVRWAVREARLRHAAVHLVCAYHGDARLRSPYASSSWTARLHQRHAAARVALDLATAAATPPDRLVAELADEPPAGASGQGRWSRHHAGNALLAAGNSDHRVTLRLRETIPAMETDEARPRQGPHPPQATGVFLIQNNLFCAAGAHGLD